MFTGIIKEKGQIDNRSTKRISILTKRTSDKIGGSVAVNGVCLTVIKKKTKGQKRVLEFDLSDETLIKTTLASLKKGLLVNLERPLKLSDGLDGHLVQGHVDGVGQLVKKEKKDVGFEYSFQAPKEMGKWIVKKGSIAVDGVSLTVARAKKNKFSVALIPQTLNETNLSNLKLNDPVNLEADVIAKYVSKYVK